MRLTLLGTGSALPDPHRAGPAALIHHGPDYLLVDCGSGVTRQLVAARVPPERVGTVLFTHHHFDHNVDFGHFVLAGWVLGRREPITVYGPPGTERICETLLDLHAADINARLGHERLDPNGIRLDCHEVAGGRLREAQRRIPGGADTPTGAIVPRADAGDESLTVLERPGLRVRAVRVDHGSIEPAYAYRFDAAGRSIVISGDTRPCDALVALARDCDVLVHEVYQRSGLDAWKTAFPHHARRADAIARAHTADTEVGAIAARANAKTLVVTHVTPPQIDEPALRHTIAADFSGEIVIGADGQTF